MNPPRANPADRVSADVSIDSPAAQPPCRFCLKQRDLRRSHIIPEFLYGPTYDQIHRAIHINRTRGKEKPLQKGLREPLLCGDCEQRFSVLESTFSKMWVSGAGPRGVINGDHVLVSGLDYSSFKLFHLSILWRAGVSSLGPFAQVQLGMHEAIIRTALLARTAPPPDRYQLFAFVLIDPLKRRVLDDVIISPVRQKLHGRTCYVFMFAGCVWIYVVSNRPLEGHATSGNAFLSAAGSIIMPVIDLNEFSPLDREMIDHLHKATDQAGKHRR
jgi:hypothetical protein